MHLSFVVSDSKSDYLLVTKFKLCCVCVVVVLIRLHTFAGGPSTWQLGMHEIWG